MRINLKSKKVLAVGVAAVTVVSGGAAYAYWTAGGAGTGTAETAAGNEKALTTNQTTVVTPMYPGDSPQTLSGTFGNTNSGPVYVTSVTASITSVDDGDGDPLVGCTAADFNLANPVMAVGAEVAKGDPVGAWTGASISFKNNTTTNQDICKSATVTLGYVVV